jgi:5-methylcytosine-specific restriction endonuclease McrA
MKTKRFPLYIRKGKASIEDIIPLITGDTKVKVRVCDKSVGVSSFRLQNFKEHGTDCAYCGIKGSFFAVERHNVETKYIKYHLNLYALDDKGNEVLMTADHIIPRSKGGLTTLDNLQTLCCICNLKKADKLEV